MGIRPRAIALEAARRAPTALVPCPECGVPVGAAKLSRHLDEVHGATDETHEVAELRGDDRAFVVPLAWFGGLGFVASFALGIALDRERLFAGIAAAILGTALGLIGLAWFGAIRSRVRLAPEAVELRYALGLLRRRVRLEGATIEIGSVTSSRAPAGSNDVNVPHEEVRVGAYVRVSDGRATITFAHRGASLRKRWSDRGIRSGPKRSHVDVRLDTPALVVVEHALHAAGALQLREPPANRDAS
jgi:hypothetical protein